MTSLGVDPLARSLRNLSRREFIGLATALGLSVSCQRSDETSSPTVASRTSTFDDLVIPDPTDAIVTRWRADPFARGSYSFLANGSTALDRERLAEPSGGRLFFAGEATDWSFPSTVHGALRSGRRAAAEILDYEAESVIIIGAGAAGLAAANLLVEADLDVTVIEARERVGGRVWTESIGGKPVDLGASFIHGVGGNLLMELADSANITTAPYDGLPYLARDMHGDVLSESEIPEDFDIVTTIEGEYGADANELSPEATTEGEEYRGGNALVPGGFRSLLDPLVDEVEIRRKTVVERVEVTSQEVVVSADSDSFRADAVLITVPLGVLKAGDIEFVPPLDQDRQGAIDRLGMGLLNKICLRFDEVFWEPDVDLIGYLGPDRGWFAEWLNLAKYIGEPMLIGFSAASAAEAIEQLSDDETIAAAMTSLRSMYQPG